MTGTFVESVGVADAPAVDAASAEPSGRPAAVLPGQAGGPGDGRRLCAGSAGDAVVRVRCGHCGIALAVDADDADGDAADIWDPEELAAERGGFAEFTGFRGTADGQLRIPMHAALPASHRPFDALPCAGGGLRANPRTDAVPAPAPEPPAPPRRVLPAGLDWRRQPFSHRS